MARTDGWEIAALVHFFVTILLLNMEPKPKPKSHCFSSETQTKLAGTFCLVCLVINRQKHVLHNRVGDSCEMMMKTVVFLSFLWIVCQRQ